MLRWLRGLGPKPDDVDEHPADQPVPDELVNFSIRPPDKTSVTINGLEMDLVEYFARLAEAEGDPVSVFMRKRLLEGLGSYLSGKNRNAWKAYKLIGESRENF